MMYCESKYLKVLDANFSGKDFTHSCHFFHPVYPLTHFFQSQTQIKASKNTFPRRQCHKMLSYIGQKFNNTISILPSSHLTNLKCQRMAPYSRPLNIKASEVLELFSFSLWSSKSAVLLNVDLHQWFYIWHTLKF